MLGNMKFIASVDGDILRYLVSLCLLYKNIFIIPQKKSSIDSSEYQSNQAHVKLL